MFPNRTWLFSEIYPFISKSENIIKRDKINTMHRLVIRTKRTLCEVSLSGNKNETPNTPARAQRTEANESLDQKTEGSIKKTKMRDICQNATPRFIMIAEMVSSLFFNFLPIIVEMRTTERTNTKRITM